MLELEGILETICALARVYETSSSEPGKHCALIRREKNITDLIPSSILEVVFPVEIMTTPRACKLTDRPYILYIRKSYPPAFQFMFVVIHPFVLSTGACLKISWTRHQRFKKIYEMKKLKSKKILSIIFFNPWELGRDSHFKKHKLGFYFFSSHKAFMFS